MKPRNLLAVLVGPLMTSLSLLSSAAPADAAIGTATVCVVVGLVHASSGVDGLPPGRSMSGSYRLGGEAVCAGSGLAGAAIDSWSTGNFGPSCGATEAYRGPTSRWARVSDPRTPGMVLLASSRGRDRDGRMSPASEVDTSEDDFGTLVVRVLLAPHWASGGLALSKWREGVGGSGSTNA